MTTAEVQSLLDENTCLSCYGLSLSDLIKIGLLSDISSSGGGGGGTPSLPLNSVQFNDGGVFGGDSDFTWNKTTNLLAITGGIALTAEANETPLSVSSYSLTGANAQSMLSLAGTWNTSGAPTAIDLNIVDTASSAASLLFNLRLGGISKLSVRKDGFSVFPFGIGVDNVYSTGGSLSFSTGVDFVLQTGRLRFGVSFTVATLPAAGTIGRIAYVTNALAPAYLTPVAGGGAIVCPVFDNGVAWVAI